MTNEKSKTQVDARLGEKLNKPNWWIDLKINILSINIQRLKVTISGGRAFEEGDSQLGWFWVWPQIHRTRNGKGRMLTVTMIIGRFLTS